MGLVSFETIRGLPPNLCGRNVEYGFEQNPQQMGNGSLCVFTRIAQRDCGSNHGCFHHRGDRCCGLD